MKELVIISGKGGTGKTSIAASFAILAENSVLADCDVDAADLHLVMAPEIVERGDFSGGKLAAIDNTSCISCGKCLELCRFGAITAKFSNSEARELFSIDPISCEGCGVCAWFCPVSAIGFEPAINGEWFVSNTRCGPLAHARLGIAQENSGKLVSTVKAKAKAVAEQQCRELIIIDGSPGIGCPVIASLSGADLALIVTEPTLSGLHDLERVAELLRHFKIPGMVCVNKWDINPEITEKIEEAAIADYGLSIAGRVRYDRAVTQAQVRRQTVVEHQEDGSAEDIREIWRAVETQSETGAWIREKLS